MGAGDPLAYFITWTVYGSHLQGDPQGWRHRGKGYQLPQPQLADWHRMRLKHDLMLLSSEQRKVIELECEHHCCHRVGISGRPMHDPPTCMWLLPPSVVQAS